MALFEIVKARTLEVLSTLRYMLVIMVVTLLVIMVMVMLIVILVLVILSGSLCAVGRSSL